MFSLVWGILGVPIVVSAFFWFGVRLFEKFISYGVGVPVLCLFGECF